MIKLQIISTSQKKSTAMVIVTDELGNRYTRHLRLLDNGYIQGVTLPTYDKGTWMESNKNPIHAPSISEKHYDPKHDEFKEFVPLRIWDNMLEKSQLEGLKMKIRYGYEGYVQLAK